ncbi:hypothetical protein [Roseomonas sp. KE0001]|uniref:hypothetical protein n=1 Tax=Roseomonas sp. KE0001 TaxID=2479201 RepID=UPI0018DEF6BA|nr:hypothetical protein [Roseomonas sp. KE0001]
MSKSPTRLSTFEIPRDQSSRHDEQPAREPSIDPLTKPTVPVAPPPAVQQTGTVIPQPAPPPAEEPRRQIGARVPLSIAERLRTYMYVSREPQQDVVEAALHAYLTSKGF